MIYHESSFLSLLGDSFSIIKNHEIMEERTKIWEGCVSLDNAVRFQVFSTGLNEVLNGCCFLVKI